MIPLAFIVVFGHCFNEEFYNPISDVLVEEVVKTRYATQNFIDKSHQKVQRPHYV
jgi:hypothetical protein